MLPAQQRLIRSLANLGIYMDDDDREETNLDSSKTLTLCSEDCIDQEDENAQSEYVSDCDIGRESEDADRVEKDADKVTKDADKVIKDTNIENHSNVMQKQADVEIDAPEAYIDNPEISYLEDCGSMSSEVGYVMDDIEPGMYLRVVSRHIETPGHFHVMLKENSSIFQDFMAELELHLQRTSTILHKSGTGCLFMPPFDIISAGLPVGIRRTADNKWHRGVVIKKSLKHKTVRVYLIDHGDFEDTQVSNLQAIPNRFIHAMKAQGIRCRALMGKNYNYKTPTGYPVYFNAGGGWKDAEGDIMRRLVQDQTLGLKFIKAKTDMLGPYWLVYIHMMDGDSNRISLHHVEQKVLEMYRNTYFPHDEDYEDTLKEIEFTLLASDQ